MNFPFAEKIVSAGGRCYLYGGALRNQIMSIPVADYDFVVTGMSGTYMFNRLLSICNECGDAQLHKYMPDAIRLNTKDFGMVDICLSGNTEGTPNGKTVLPFMIENTIHQFLRTLDFTFNAVAQDTYNDNVYSIPECFPDLYNKKVSLISLEGMCRHPAAIIRAARFISTFNGFTIDEKTMEVFNRDKELMFEMPEDRIRYEMYRFQNSYKAYIGEIMLRNLGILNRLQKIMESKPDSK